MHSNISLDDQTIIAQCTPRGSGAIALLRLSGVDVRAIVSTMSILPGKKIIDVPSHSIHFGWVSDENGNHIDQVLFMVMDGPKTFTGQSTIEITCHNNQFLIEEIIQQALRAGARLAHEGEFSKRAFLNGKIDLLQAEAIDELINANTQLALKKSLAQIEGSFSSWIAEIETKLLKALAFCEASFEFLDEEQEFESEILNNLNEILKTIDTLKKSFDVQKHIRQGIRIAFIGSVNAGKSSLFNSLLNQKRAIVTPIAGTTRDVIEAGLYRDGNYWTLVDTAGLRKTNDFIEQEGIKRSMEEAQKADIILLVLDNARSLDLEEKNIYQNIFSEHKNKTLVLKNKADLPEKMLDIDLGSPILVSGKTQKNIDALEVAIREKINALLHKAESSFLLNERQFNLLLTLEQKLLNIQPMLKQSVQYELVSFHLKDAITSISELTGKSVSEMGMDAVFKQFCVGK